MRLLQRKGEIVAVTGDGTNDAPALNFANVGLSMGSGTSVAKDASDITLLDDSFTSIASAVMWGRSLYRNIQRFVLFQLTINFAAIIVVFVGSIFGTEMPLTVVQILWVNIIMDTFAALAMASLPPNPAVMNEPPRPKDEFIITPAMARTIFTCGTIFVGVLLGMLFYWRATTGEPQSRTTDRFLLCIRLSAVLEYVQRQRLRSVPFGAARSAGKPYVLLGAAVDRRRTGIDRGIRRSGVPYYAAHVGTMARSDRLYLSDRYSGRCRAEYPPPHPSPSRLSVSGENRFFRCGRNLVFGK